MKKRPGYFSYILFGLIIATLLLSLSVCRKLSVEKLYKKDLFEIVLGKLEDQIDLFEVIGSTKNVKNDFYIKDGMFYIANSNSSKIMQFTSYGDLIFILYNPDPYRNPTPIVLQSEDVEGKITNRYAAKYGIQNIGSIAVDSLNNIYIEDTVPEDQAIIDNKEDVVLSSRILRFNRQGKFINYIGQDGIGGTPFPYIYDIHLTVSDELVVVSRIPSAWLVFWFTKEGRLLYASSFELEKLPKEKNYLPNLELVYPDLKNYQVYLHISYFVEEIDHSTKMKSTIKSIYSRIYVYNIETKRYEHFFKVAEGEKRKYNSDFGSVEIPRPSFEFIGVNRKGFLYFLRPDLDGDYELLILDSSGKVVSSRYLVLTAGEEYKLYLKKIILTQEGIISGLLGFKDRVKMVWWRSDKLTSDIKNER